MMVGLMLLAPLTFIAVGEVRKTQQSLKLKD
jgi:hypothetical protein